MGEEYPAPNINLAFTCFREWSEWKLIAWITMVGTVPPGQGERHGFVTTSHQDPEPQPKPVSLPCGLLYVAKQNNNNNNGDPTPPPRESIAVSRTHIQHLPGCDSTSVVHRFGYHTARRVVRFFDDAV